VIVISSFTGKRIMFKTDEERAIAYAAMKSLERMLSDSGKISAGFCSDISGSEITVILPEGSVVERDAGLGDGTVLKTATQNLYGYALWALMIAKLKKFNQWKKIKSCIIESMQEVILRSCNKNLKDEIIQEYPEVLEEINSIQDELQIPARVEDTPRIFKKPKLPVTVKITFKKG
jgi:hypothetical protein